MENRSKFQQACTLRYYYSIFLQPLVKEKCFLTKLALEYDMCSYRAIYYMYLHPSECTMDIKNLCQLRQ